MDKMRTTRDIVEAKDHDLYGLVWRSLPRVRDGMKGTEYAAAHHQTVDIGIAIVARARGRELTDNEKNAHRDVTNRAAMLARLLIRPRDLEKGDSSDNPHGYGTGTAAA